MILLRETFRCRGGYTQLPLRRDACTQVLWHANTCTQCFYGHILLRRDSSTRIACKHFYIENFWHTVAGAFTCKYFYTAKLILCMFLFTYMHALSQGYFRSYMLSITHAFIQRCFYTETPLHRDAFAQGCFHAQKWFFAHILLQRDDFTWAILRTDAKTSRSAFTKECISTRSFYLWAFLHTTEWFPTVDMHMAQKNSANICKITLSPQLLTFETHIMGQGWPSASPHSHCNLTSMYDDRHFAQESCIPWTLIHAALAL